MRFSEVLEIIRHYQPTFFNAAKPASAEEISTLEKHAGALPEDYRSFLATMGNRCPILDNKGYDYSPAKMIQLVYEDEENPVPAGYLIFALDGSGNGFHPHYRLTDGAVLLVPDGWGNEGNVVENAIGEALSLGTYFLHGYVESVLVPSFPVRYTGVTHGDADKIRRILSVLETKISASVLVFKKESSDLIFYGGEDFVVGLRIRPPISKGNYESSNSPMLAVYLAALDLSRLDEWKAVVETELTAIPLR